jgi:hypothetical protein
MSMKNSNDTIGNRSRDLPVCSAVPQPLRHRVPYHQYKEGLETEMGADTKWCFPKVLKAINKYIKDSAGAGYGHQGTRIRLTS